MLRWAKKTCKRSYFKNVVKQSPWLEKLLISMQMKHIFEEF